MSHLRTASPQLVVVGILCLSFVLLLGCSGKEEEKTPEELGKPESMDQEVFERASKALAKQLTGTWVQGLPKSHPEYDPSKMPAKDLLLEIQFTAANTAYISVGSNKKIFIYSVSGKVIKLHYQGSNSDPQEMKFTLYSEDMITLEMDGNNLVFARKGK